MATQLAPTPKIKGAAAKAVYQEMQRKPTPASKRGAQVLHSKYGKLVK